MSQALLLGIDVGTSRAKVGAFDTAGQVVALETVTYAPVTTPEPGAAEQDAWEWWTRIAAALRDVLEQIDRKAALGVAINGQGPTLVALDESLRPTAPALTWLDGRSARHASTLSKRAERFVPLHSFLAKAMFLAEAKPDAYQAARSFVQAWDFVASQLVGKPVVSSAEGVLPWDSLLLAASELEPSKFPPIQRMGEQVGVVSAEAAQATGLTQGLPVIGGITDYFGGILGGGAVKRGVACDSGGTSSGLNVCWDEPLYVKGIFCVPSFEPGMYYVGGPASTTGRALEWWRTDILQAAEDDWTPADDAAAVPAGSEGLIFLPYLAGERAPIWDTEARGAFFGLSLNHGRAHMTRAVMEGVAFALCHIAEHITDAGASIETVHCCGGQAASDVWCQIKADVLGRQVTVPQVTEGSVLGAAVIAGAGVGVFESFTHGSMQMMRPRATFEPDAARHAAYQTAYARYRELYRALKPLYAADWHQPPAES